MAKKWAELRDRTFTDPVRRERNHLGARAIITANRLARLREQRAATQGAAPTGSDAPAADSICIEHEEDTYLTELRLNVAAIGGQIQIVAVFPDGERIELCPAPLPDCEEADTAISAPAGTPR